MRTIKFRGRKHTGEWLYGDLVHSTDGEVIGNIYDNSELLEIK